MVENQVEILLNFIFNMSMINYDLPHSKDHELNFIKVRKSNNCNRSTHPKLRYDKDYVRQHWVRTYQSFLVLPDPSPDLRNISRQDWTK